MAGPTDDQRRVLASIVGRDTLGQGTFAFYSPELLGLEPEVYRGEFLDDLVLLEAADEENDPLERFGVRAVLRVFRALGGCKMVGFSFSFFTSLFFLFFLFFFWLCSGLYPTADIPSLIFPLLCIDCTDV